jgi:hypothetical protein
MLQYRLADNHLQDLQVTYTLKMGVKYSSETLITTNKTTLRHSPQDHSHFHRREDCRCHTSSVMLREDLMYVCLFFHSYVSSSKTLTGFRFRMGGEGLLALN